MFLGVSLTAAGERESRVSTGNPGPRGDADIPALAQGPSYQKEGEETAHLFYCHGGYKCLKCLRLSRAGSTRTWLGKRGPWALGLQAPHPSPLVPAHAEPHSPQRATHGHAAAGVDTPGTVGVPREDAVCTGAVFHAVSQGQLSQLRAGACEEQLLQEKRGTGGSARPGHGLLPGSTREKVPREGEGSANSEAGNRRTEERTHRGLPTSQTPS